MLYRRVDGLHRDERRERQLLLEKRRALFRKQRSAAVMIRTFGNVALGNASLLLGTVDFCDLLVHGVRYTNGHWSLQRYQLLFGVVEGLLCFAYGLFAAYLSFRNLTAAVELHKSMLCTFRDYLFYALVVPTIVARFLLSLSVIVCSTAIGLDSTLLASYSLNGFMRFCLVFVQFLFIYVTYQEYDLKANVILGGMLLAVLSIGQHESDTQSWFGLSEERLICFIYFCIGHACAYLLYKLIWRPLMLALQDADTAPKDILMPLHMELLVQRTVAHIKFGLMTCRWQNLTDHLLATISSSTRSVRHGDREKHSDEMSHDLSEHMAKAMRSLSKKFAMKFVKSVRHAAWLEIAGANYEATEEIKMAEVEKVIPRKVLLGFYRAMKRQTILPIRASIQWYLTNTELVWTEVAKAKEGAGGAEAERSGS